MNTAEYWFYDSSKYVSKAEKHGTEQWLAEGCMTQTNQDYLAKPRAFPVHL